MSVIERARQVQGFAGCRVLRARPSEPRAGTVAPLSVRTLTGGDVGIGRDVRPSYVQVDAGAAHEEYHRGQLALCVRLLGKTSALTQLIEGGE